MQKFSEVLKALRNWYESFAWYSLLRSFEMHLLFGGLGVLLLKVLLYQILPYSSYTTLNTLFYTIPLSAIAYHAFLLGIWLTLASVNVKYTPYGLWAYAFIDLFPFTGMSLSSLITPAVYIVLGYALFRYTSSSYSELASRA
ncbi:hypothetical protein ACLBWT_17185 [Paenibacillus sp. D51F]